MPYLNSKRHERAVTNVLFCCRHSNPSGEQLLFLTRILAITITMWIAFRDSSHGVMPCIVVIISLLPRKKESIMLFTHAELQKQYREAYERDHAVNNRLAV